LIYHAENGAIRMLLAGDAMPSRRLMPFDEPDYLALVELLRSADIAFVNLETTVRNRDEGAPGWTQGTPMTTPPVLLEDLKWLGFGLLSNANNHATDYGTGGLIATLKHVQAAGLPCAGAGANLAEARMPVYADTRAGRVGLVAATSFFRPWNRAADQRPDSPGRPGINPLRFSTRYTVDAAMFAELKRGSEQLGLTAERARHRAAFFSAKETPSDQDDTLTFLGSQFRKGDGFHVITSINREDADAVLRQIKEARRQADWVIFSFHSHEFGAGGRLTAATDVDMEEMADFYVAFAHAAIDAGADVVAGHGPHLTLGVEIYRGRPILYSLGNFIFQNDTVEVFPAEAYQRFGLPHEATPADFLDTRTDGGKRGFPASPEFWEGLAAECEFRDRALSAVRLYPLDLGHGRPRAQRGRPLLARGDIAQRALARIDRLSQRFGTRMVIEKDIATVRLA
jgi:poly-gamma-glutamate synthesis protein (capsule biosynthesis protein)